MGHAVSIIEGVQMPKCRCQWQPNITCLQKRWPAAALTCLCYGPELFLILTTGLNCVVVKTALNKTKTTLRPESIEIKTRPRPIKKNKTRPDRVKMLLSPRRDPNSMNSLQNNTNLKYYNTTVNISPQFRKHEYVSKSVYPSGTP